MPVALLSNAHDCLRADLAALGLTQLFSEVICSAEEHVVKPGREIYHRACQRLGVPPGQALFLDDRIENVLGARAAGVSADLFTSAGQIASLLEQPASGPLQAPSCPVPAC
jgi:putative hydrolase of the HAD superfamily